MRDFYRRISLGGALLSCFALAGLALPGVALAQFDEIVVTARKVEENLQDVPIAVSPFNSETIKELNLQNLDQLALFTPGLSFNSAFGRQSGSDRPAVRGIATIVNGIGNSSSMAYFVDGVYQGGTPQTTTLFNIERVEILKGPQSAQFGRGTYVGAINYVTRERSDVVEGQVQAKLGEDNYYVASGWVGLPVTDSLGFYLSGGVDKFGGQFTNQFDGEDIGGERTYDFTGKVFFSPSENFDVTLRIGYQDAKDDHFAMYLQPRGLNNSFFRGAAGSGVAPRAREYYTGEAVPDWDAINLRTDLLDLAGGSGVQKDRTIATLKLEWEVAQDVVLSSTTGYIRDDEITGFDASYAGYEPFPFPPFLNGAFFQWDDNTQKDISQELRAVFDHAEAFSYQVGLYYYKGEAVEKDDRFVTLAGAVSNTNPFTGAVSLENEEIENIAVFGGVTWNLSDAFTLGLDLRWAEDEITVYDRTAANPGCTEDLCNDTFDSFTPRLTGVWTVNDNVNLYGNIAKGTKPGNFNNNIPDDRPELRKVDEEEAWNYEIGAKTVWLDGRANANLALYFIDVEDQQLTTVVELAGGSTTSVLQNAGETEVLGLEFDGAMQFTDNLTAGLTYAYTDSEITQRFSLDQADLLGGDGTFQSVQTLGDVSGKSSPRVPEHTASLFTRFEQQLTGDSSWFVSATYAYESSRFAQEHNLIETGDRDLVGLQAGYSVNNWDFTVWGKNITDDDTPVDILRYIDRRSGSLTGCAAVDPAANCSGASTSPRGFALTPQRQKQWGVTVNYRFGGQAD